MRNTARTMEPSLWPSPEVFLTLPKDPRGYCDRGEPLGVWLYAGPPTFRCRPPRLPVHGFVVSKLLRNSPNAGTRVGKLSPSFIVGIGVR